jgi:broad specificity phosphatase PhoE
MEDLCFTVLLVASGTSEWEESGRIQGAADLPLCPKSRQSFLASLDAVAALAAGGKVFAGPDEASRQSAELLEERASIPSKTIDEFRGQSLGLWEGERLDGLEERCCRSVRQWKADPSSVVAPDGEAWEDFLARLWQGVRRTFRRRSPEDGPIVIIARPPVCRAMAISAAEAGIAVTTLDAATGQPITEPDHSTTPNSNTGTTAIPGSGVVKVDKLLLHPDQLPGERTQTTIARVR